MMLFVWDEPSFVTVEGGNCAKTPQSKNVIKEYHLTNNKADWKIKKKKDLCFD